MGFSDELLSVALVQSLLRVTHLIVTHLHLSIKAIELDAKNAGCGDAVPSVFIYFLKLSIISIAVF